MNIVFDENLPLLLARAFGSLQFGILDERDVLVYHITDLFGKGLLDEEWIPKIGRMGSIVITQDINMRRVKSQFVLLEKYKVMMFIVRPQSGVGFNHWNMVQILVKHWGSIKDIARRETGPSFYEITPKISTPRLLS